MKTGIKTIQSEDYEEVVEEVLQLEWLDKEFFIQCPRARIDTPRNLSHEHKWWEWARALHEIKKLFFKLFLWFKKIKSLPNWIGFLKNSFKLYTFFSNYNRDIKLDYTCFF